MKLVFYTLYRWAKKYNYWDSPHLSAMYFLGLLISINFLTIYQFASIIGGDLPDPFSHNKIFMALVLAVAAFLIYMLFVRNKKYEVISLKYESSEINFIAKGNFTTILYIVLTVFLFFGLAFFDVK